MIRRPPRSPLFPYPPLSRSPVPDATAAAAPAAEPVGGEARGGRERQRVAGRAKSVRPDRKSTRLNSSHLVISYAVFCLKKKKKTNKHKRYDGDHYAVSPRPM